MSYIYIMAIFFSKKKKKKEKERKKSLSQVRRASCQTIVAERRVHTKVFASTVSTQAREIGQTVSWQNIREDARLH